MMAHRSPDDLTSQASAPVPTPAPKPHTHLGPKHRISHTKSRKGCYTCKSRRVKCDEERPVCGACSIRGNDCVFPITADTRDPPRRPPASRSKGPETHGVSIRPLDFDITTEPKFTHDSLKRNMNMSDLKLLKHYILHTSKRMTLHHDKALVWERVIPDIASENEYLMHLLLALTGLDVLTTESSLSQGSASSRGQSMANERMHESSLLQIVIEHHYQGLKGLQQEIDTSDHTNAEYLLAGSLLLVCFAFASLRVRDLDTSSQHYPAVNNSSQIGNYNLGKPQAQWLSLVHGVTSIVRQSWMELQKSRLRHLLVFNLANDDWKHLSYELSTPFKLHNDIRSAKLSLFMSNAFQAIYNLRTFSSTLKITIAANTKNDDLASSQSPGSDSSGDDSICSLLAEHDQAIDIVEMMYMRILHVLCLRRTGTQISDYEIQSEIEDAAIASWPDLVGQRFISSLNSQTLLRPAHGLSFTILAHLYLTLALLDNIWFFGGTFDLEIQKIGALITQIADVQLIELMKWPMAVISQGQGPQNSIQQ